MARVAKAKDCPFCRSSDTFVDCYDFGNFYVQCNNCSARGPMAEGDGCDPDADKARGRRGAVRAWNVRRRTFSCEPVS